MPKIRNFVKLIISVSNWPFYLLEFWLKRKGIFKYEMRDGNIFYIRVDSDDRYILNEIYVHKVYNPKGFEINKNDIVVDIGAHKGIFALLVSKQAKEGLVLAFEPSPENFSFLKKHVEINNASNIKAFNIVVSNKSGKIKFYMAKDRESTGRHSLYKPKEKFEEIEVKTITLAGIMKKNKIKRINFLKLDCEGAEYDILFESKNLLNKIDKIAMEYHNIDKKRNALVLKKYLEEQGFHVLLPNFNGK